ncbi:MAG: SAM-dependent methyltransferase [Candidatus Promineifilaceae bacterium]
MPRNYTCFSRYLSSKKTLDDRALNRYVWDTLKATLPNKRLRIVELGAGIGTMIERVVEWDLVTQADYHAIDMSAANIQVLEDRVRQLACDGICVSAETANIFDYIASNPQRCDLLIAHHFLDLLPLEQALPKLLSLLKPNGYFYFTLNFDGITAFEPSVHPSFDEQIERLYHATMDDRPTGGDSKCGRHLLQLLRECGADLLASGSSDWVVHSEPNSRYHADEAYFLHFIISTIESALAAHPALDAEQFARWVDTRHAQIDRGELMYFAHQLDVFGRITSPPLT